MSNKKLTGKALVIQIGQDELRMAVMTLGAAMPQIQQHIILPVPEGAVEDGVLRNTDALRELLHPTLSLPEYRRTRRVVFSVCSTQIISERVTVPAVNEKKLERLLQSNMDVYFPVDAKDYRLVWQVVGKTEGADGAPALEVQLWAVPKGLLLRYYALANDCGLSVAAVDYCGCSLVNAVDASFAAAGARKSAGRSAVPKARRSRNADMGEGTATAVLDRDEAPDTRLYLLAESDFLLMTFVQEQRVVLQRLLPGGGDLDGELSEAQMVLEYFRAMETGRGSQLSGVLCGKRAGDPLFADAVRGTLYIPVQLMPCQPGPEWCVCLGASRAALDFGDPTLNHPKGARRQLGGAWQYVLVLAGGAALAAALLLTFGTRAVWSSTLDGLNASARSLQLQAAQSAGYAQNYYNYSNTYDSYSGDWDTLFASLRTYNDNLTLALDELESILPKTTSVETIGIADEGLALQFACPSKEEAAYIIIALRHLQYATLDSISDLTVGPGVTAQQVLPSLAARNAANAEAEAAAAAAAQGQSGGMEAPPTVGGYDLATLLEIMEQASQESGSSDYSDILDYAISSGLITREDLEEAVMSLTPEQLTALEEAYGLLPSIPYTLDELLEDAEFEERKAALSTMLTEDPIAQYRFFLAFRKDLERPAGKEILFNEISSDLMNNPEILAMLSGDKADIEAGIPVLVEILTKDETTLAATEELIKTDESLAKRYAYYLAVEMGLQEKIDGVGDISEDTIKDILDDIKNGTVPEDLPETTDPDKVSDALDSLVENLAPEGSGDLWQQIIGGGSGSSNGSGSSDGNSGNSDNSGSSGNSGGSVSDELWQQLLNEYLNGNLPTSGSDSGLDSLINSIIGGGGDIFNGGGSGTGTGTGGAGAQEPQDTRIYFTVTLGYKSTLIEAELERKGLSYEDKLDKLEVER